ncbi:MAG: phospho-N-acetylmuramoyl-pentapeptide-transferase [Neisseria sp.]|nr:phospho-N-acetylmuramoyl-pentapeptide-transferase [Neisseria sp.]
MFLWLVQQFDGLSTLQHLFKYTTFRAIMAAMTSLALLLTFGSWMIRKLQQLHVGQSVRTDGPETHLVKSGTPTMGGLLIVVGITVSTLLWGDLQNEYIWVLLAVLLSAGGLGFYDDYLKVLKRNSKGVSSRYKMVWLSVTALAAGLVLFQLASGQDGYRPSSVLVIPFIKQFSMPLGVVGFLVLAYFTIVGTSNAVNLTDGLDGLAAFPVMAVAAGLAVFAYVAGHAQFSGYLHMPFVPGANEVVVFCAAICGSALGFLWFNAYPAAVFMGDVGSLSLGAALGAVAVIIRQEFVLAIMGILFVVEALSVILQVGWYKRTRRRIFLMTPIHHHFEKKGWPETQVVIRFWILTIIACLVGLSSLKIR